MNASRWERGTALSLARSRVAPRVCPPLRARAREVAGGCARSCSLTPAAAPTHCTPAPLPHRRTEPALPPQSVSRSRPPLRLSSSSLSCLVSFHRSQPRSRRVEGSALHAQPAAASRTAATRLPAAPLPLCRPPAAWTRVPSPPPPPRRGRPRPDTAPPLHSGRIKPAQKAPHDEDCSVSSSSRQAGLLRPPPPLLPPSLPGETLAGLLSGCEG